MDHVDDDGQLEKAPLDSPPFPVRTALVYIVVSALGLIALTSTAHVDAEQRVAIDLGREILALATLAGLARGNDAKWQLQQAVWSRQALVLGGALAMAFLALQATTARLPLGVSAAVLPLAALVGTLRSDAPLSQQMPALLAAGATFLALAGLAIPLHHLVLVLATTATQGAITSAIYDRIHDDSEVMSRSALLASQSAVLIGARLVTAAYAILATSWSTVRISLFGSLSLGALYTITASCLERVLFLQLLERFDTVDYALALWIPRALVALCWTRDTAYLPVATLFATLTALAWLSHRTASSFDAPFDAFQRHRRALFLIPLLSLLAWTAMQVVPPLDYILTPRLWPAARVYTIDVIVSHYNEAGTGDYIRDLRLQPWARDGSSKLNVIVYCKNPRTDECAGLYREGADEVVDLPNAGREGGTYLAHILRLYNDTALPPRRRRRPTLADYTLFVQGEESWMEVVAPRLHRFHPSSGIAYLHLGTLWRLENCTHDAGNGMDWPRMRDIYQIFRQELCPPGTRLGGWQAQMIVSRDRIMSNTYAAYDHMHALVTADASHWIHQAENIGWNWGEHGSWDPSNPAIGHSLERSWPGIFRCDDPTIAERCPNGEGEATMEACACF